MVISINCMVGLSDELVGSSVEVVVPTAPNHHRQRTMLAIINSSIYNIYIYTSSSTDPITTSTLTCLSSIIFQKSIEVSASGCCVSMYSALLPKHYQGKEREREREREKMNKVCVYVHV